MILLGSLCVRFFFFVLWLFFCFFFFFSSRRRHTRWTGDWSSDVCSSDLERAQRLAPGIHGTAKQARLLPRRHDHALPARTPSQSLGGRAARLECGGQCARPVSHERIAHHRPRPLAPLVGAAGRVRPPSLWYLRGERRAGERRPAERHGDDEWLAHAACVLGRVRLTCDRARRVRWCPRDTAAPRAADARAREET